MEHKHNNRNETVNNKQNTISAIDNKNNKPDYTDKKTTDQSNKRKQYTQHNETMATNKQ